jgi:hypothetical protein
MLLVCFVLAVSAPSYAELDLKAVHPDEPADYTFNERFSAKQSLQSLDSIISDLESFRRLTEAAAGKLSKKELEKIGNTGWESQNLGFVNQVNSIKGTLLKQEYLIKKLAHELAQRKLKAGESKQKEALEAEREYKKAEKQFQTFWNDFGLAD